MAKWSIAARKAQSARMKKFWKEKHTPTTQTGIVHTPVDLTHLIARKVTIPTDARDIASIFGRYARMSEEGKAFVRAQFKRCAL